MSSKALDRGILCHKTRGASKEDTFEYGWRVIGPSGLTHGGNRDNPTQGSEWSAED